MNRDDGKSSSGPIKGLDIPNKEGNPGPIQDVIMSILTPGKSKTGNVNDTGMSTLRFDPGKNPEHMQVHVPQEKVEAVQARKIAQLPESAETDSVHVVHVLPTAQGFAQPTAVSSPEHTMHFPQLQAFAMLALCKLTIIDADFCEANLQLLFTVLENAPSETVRSNCTFILSLE
ncbi:uncharacterized protein A4U43_C08F27840 [Asparagus officinalis]|nr:uncharacterized protein A4U43_C08F27840 [Asparagus officinalis]